MIRINRTNCAKSCLDMFDGAIILEIWYHEQVLIIKDLHLVYSDLVFNERLTEFSVDKYRPELASEIGRNARLDYV